jgi:sugar/nucleoside kinase (ribokinase family)
MITAYNFSASSILGIGSPCVDLLYNVDDQCIEDLKLNKGDGRPAASAEEFEKMRAYCENRKFISEIASGGSAANTIQGLAALGKNCSFFGKIGLDSAGDFLKKTANVVGIKLRLLTSEKPTTQIAVFVTKDKQRTFMTCLGAGQDLAEKDVSAEIFKDVQLVHIEGYLLENFALVEKVMQVAQKLGIAISLDVGCIRVIKNNKLELLRLIRSYVNVLFCNQDECLQLTNKPPKEGCAELSRLVPVVCVFNGKDGSWVGANGTVFQTPTRQVEVVDTTGAGDLSASGFLYGLSNNWSLEDCAWLSNYIGTTSVTVPGAIIPPAQWDEIKKAMSERGLRAEG